MIKTGIIEALNHPKLFKPWFNGASWNGWRTVLKATNGLTLSGEEIEFFKSIAGNREPPKRRVREAWFVVGRGGGKDSIASAIAAHAAASFDPEGILRPGERAVVACFATDKDQAKILFRYVKSYFDSIKPLRAMVERVADSDGIIELNNSVDVAILTGNFRSVRGRPLLCAILDEIAFFRDDGSLTPDVELYRALLPALRLPQSMLIGISSPYRKAGLLYDRWHKTFGQSSDDVLTIQAPSHVMNPVLDLRERDRMMQDDPAAGRAEFYAEFRDDLVAFIDPAVVAAAMAEGRAELPYMPGRTYIAAVDPSGGSSDSMTLSIAHLEGDRGVLDLVAEWPAPFSPQHVVTEICTILRRYNLKSVVGDRYAGEWAREPFRLQGIEYQLSEWTRSEAYLTLLPALNSSRIELLDNRRLISQLCGLERRVARSGKDSVDHPRGSHDDLINSAALALVYAALKPASAADGWIAFYKAQAEGRRYDGSVDPALCDTDPIRAAGGDWSFHDPRDWCRLVVPPGPLVWDGSIHIKNQLRTFGRLGDAIMVDVKHDEARLILTSWNPVWRRHNEAMAQALGLGEAA
jgi:hypothetical protein